MIPRLVQEMLDLIDALKREHRNVKGIKIGNPIIEIMFENSLGLLRFQPEWIQDVILKLAEENFPVPNSTEFMMLVLNPKKTLVLILIAKLLTCSEYLAKELINEYTHKILVEERVFETENPELN